MKKSRDPRELLARAARLAGLDSTDGVELLGHAELPESRVGLASAPLASTEPLRMLIERTPHFTPQPLLAPPDVDASLVTHAGPTQRPLRHEDVPISVVRWETSSAVIVVEVDPPARGVHRSGLVHAWRGGALLVELASAPFSIQIEGLGAAVMLVGEPSSASEHRGPQIYLIRVAGARASAIEEHLVAAALSGFGCEEWLQAKATDLARRGTTTGRAAALGLLARLWVPRSSADRERIIAGEPNVRDRVEREAAATTSAVAAETVREALGLARELEHWTTELSVLAASSPQNARELAHRIVERRDELASIAEYLRATGRADAALELDRSLERVDAEASAQFSAFSVATDLGDDPLVQAVHWQEPDAWWGSFVDA